MLRNLVIAYGNSQYNYGTDFNAANPATHSRHSVATKQAEAALLTALATLETDGTRYRFLRPFLSMDGDVDDPDMATRFYQWVKIEDEHVHVPDAYGYASVDEAIDAAISSTPPGTDGREG